MGTCCGDKKRGQAPSCVVHKTMLQGQYSSWWTMYNVWKICLEVSQMVLTCTIRQLINQLSFFKGALSRFLALPWTAKLYTFAGGYQKIMGRQSSHSFWKVGVLGPPVPWNWGSFLLFKGPLTNYRSFLIFFSDFLCLFSKRLSYVVCSHNYIFSRLTKLALLYKTHLVAIFTF